MRELNEAAEQAQALSGAYDFTPISSNWAKWFHEGIPDGPENVREERRNFAAIQGHCLKCTSMSGCFFIEGAKTFPTYPHHLNCHCQKQNIAPNNVIADCKIEKFTGYIFSETYAHNGKKYTYENTFGYTIDDSTNLKAEFDRQAKEKYISGEYVLGELKIYGQFITIEIELDTPKRGSIIMKTGWHVHPNGLITCNTPYGGWHDKI